MLALTPAPLETAGERAFFAELTRWDTGGSVRAAVVASLPRFDDGPMRRRLADAVLFVPEGLAVVRVAEVERQSGTVTASPEGAWTIGPAGEPGEVLQLGGGGSSPLDGLMRAAMDTAVRLRRAGLEPGRIARLTVLVGGVSGLVPEDGDLGEGDQVATLEPRSLLLGIARASRHAGVDNPRLWTTADVRAALEALELPGRGPAVEELNGEAFPYSPYVLRRRDLMTPAGLAASPEVAAPEPSPPVAAAPVAAAPVAAAPPAAAPPRKRAMPPVPPPAAAPAAPAPPSPVRETVAIDVPPARDTVAVDLDVPPAPQADDTGGIGGLFAAGEADTQVAAAPPAPLPAAPVPPPAAAPVVPSPIAQPETAAPARVVPPMPPLALPKTGVLPVVTSEPAPPTAPPGWHAPGEPQAADDDERSWTGRRGLLVALGALALVVVIVVVGLSLLGGGGDDPSDPGTAGASSAAAEEPTGPQPGDTADLGGQTYTAQVVDLVDSCGDHAYGRVAEFLAATNCTGLSRALWSTEVDGKAVVVSVSRVQMPDTAAARELQRLADTTGTGNVNDLLREGKGYAGGPQELSGAEYASAVSGPVVTIVESSWAQPGAGDAATVDAIADGALGLETPPFPAG